MFYIKWTHPEVFIATLLFLSFSCLFLSKRVSAWFMCGIAGIQIISLWPIFGVFGLELLLNAKGSIKDRFVTLINSPTLLFFALFPSLSAIFYYVNYGKISLIGASYTDIELITFSHFLSFWFDLDQGVIVGAPVILLTLVISFFRWKAFPYIVKQHLLLSILASFCICLPLLAQISVNSGQSVFSSLRIVCNHSHHSLGCCIFQHNFSQKTISHTNPNNRINLCIYNVF